MEKAFELGLEGTVIVLHKNFFFTSYFKEKFTGIVRKNYSTSRESQAVLGDQADVPTSGWRRRRHWC